MDNSDISPTIQTDSGDVSAAANIDTEVPHHLESGEPNVAAIALALQNHQEALNLSRLNHFKQKTAATEVPQEASTTETETETKTETETETKKTQEALKNKTKRLAEDTLVYNILQQYSPVDI